MSTDGLRTVTIRSPGGALTAQFVPELNLVCASLQHRGTELLHPRGGLAAYAEGKTMGIPLLYPWANRLAGDIYAAAGKRVELPPADGRYARDPNGLPRHGALPRLLRWEVTAHDADAGTLAARMEWGAPVLLELYPFVHEVAVTARLRDGELAIETVVRATGEDSVPIAFGYHPYLTIAGVPRSEWEVGLGASQRLATDDLMIPTGATERLAARDFTLGQESWDAGLTGLSQPPRFSVAGGGRRLEVRFDEGYAAAQVYAPPGQDLIAFEPMTAPTNALVDGRGLTVVPPGGEYRAAFAVTVADN